MAPPCEGMFSSATPEPTSWSPVSKSSAIISFVQPPNLVPSFSKKLKPFDNGDHFQKLLFLSVLRI